MQEINSVGSNLSEVLIWCMDYVICYRIVKRLF